MAHHNVRQTSHDGCGCGEQKKDCDDAGETAHVVFSIRLTAPEIGIARVLGAFADGDAVTAEGGGPYNLDAVASSPAYVVKGYFNAFRESCLL